MKRKYIVLAVALVASGFLLGRSCTSHSEHSEIDNQHSDISFWTCSMHPQIRQQESGSCPICGMDLIPVSADADDNELGRRQIRLSPTAEKLAEIETATVERKYVTKSIRLVGKVSYDERRIADIAARVPGRLDRLYVDYTGVPVNEGDHLVYLYSPELLAAQEELIQSSRTSQQIGRDEQSAVSQRMRTTVQSSREKLELLGLTDEQIKAIEESGKPSDHLIIYAPVSGIVIQKHAIEGAYVETGTKIYTIADLSQVWVFLDAYESDIQWLHYGQDVEFQVEAYPGETFRGTIAFIAPVLDAKTRTIKVRVNVDNKELRLKPEMFVRAVVESQVAQGGKVMVPELEGKWICPMHPEIVKDGRGVCDICEMDLVEAASLGYATAKTEAPALVIPASAPLLTGKRAVVYVATPDRPGVYEGREVVLGPRAGDHYIVNEGLIEGEQVVVNGAFKIDSAIQIQAKPSMMSPAAKEGQGKSADGGSKMNDKKLHTPEAFQKQLADVFAAYVALTEAMTKEDMQIVPIAQRLLASLDKVDMDLLKGDAHMQWMEQLAALRKEAARITSGDMDTMHQGLAAFSDEFTATVQRFGLQGIDTLYVLKCPMALDGNGAKWLQRDDETRNPYFQGGMLRCGSVVDTIKVNPQEAMHHHE